MTDLNAATRETITKGRHYLLATAGSCPGSRGTGGWGYLLLLNDKPAEPRQRVHAEQVPMIATNSEMDLVAAIEGLSMLVEPNTPAIVQSISGYLITGMTEWVPMWKLNGWRDGKVENIELWKKLDAFNQARTIVWEKRADVDNCPPVQLAGRMAKLALDGRNVDEHGELKASKRLRLDASEM
ncbi:RNase H family protein [Devosia sp. A369]